MKKKIFIILCCVALCLTLTACDTGFGSLNYIGVEGSDLPSETLIATNSKYSLELDKMNMINPIETNEINNTNDKVEIQKNEIQMEKKKRKKGKKYLLVNV